MLCQYYDFKVMAARLFLQETAARPPDILPQATGSHGSGSDSWPGATVSV